MAKLPTTKDKKAKEIPGEKPIAKNKTQEFFCQLYAGVATKNFFGNATQSYLQAYGGQKEINDIEERLLTMDQEKDLGEIMKLQGRIETIKHSARSAAALLLTNISISARCDYLVNRFLDPEMADREMGYVIGQREELHAKVAAYNAVAKVKNRISNKLEGEFIFRWEDDSE